MSTSTSYISGLSSGLDWASIIDQLYEVEHQRIDLVEDRKTEYENKLSEWQSFNTLLLALQTAAQNLQDPDDFYLYTTRMSSNNSSVDAEDLLSVSTTSSAAKGSYSIKVTSLASAQKLSSTSFSDFDEALGSDYAGDIIINGTAITISETDTLVDVQDKINNANAGSNPTGVTASIISYSENDYRLTLTSDSTGADGISLQNASSSDLTILFGWKDSNETLKNSVTNGAQSDLFESSTSELATLLGLSSIQSGTIQIDGQDIAIDLSTDSLEDIKDSINNAAITGVTASIITEVNGNTTAYRLQIDGSQTFTDDQNILETLGIIQNGVSEILGTTSANTMTENGTNISASTTISDIDGYNSWTSGDSITISGTDHSNNAINESFNIDSSSTVQDLLDAIEASFEANGDDVSVYITSDGNIEVADLETGTSNLSVTLTSTISDGDLDWGTFSAVDTVRIRELVEGADAVIEVDGVTVTRSENTINDLISGVTLNLLNSDIDTTITLNIERDIDAVMENISSFVDAYNEVAAYISEQQSYDEDEEATGGILFGDGTLSSIKGDLTTTILDTVWGVSSEFSILGLAGINLDNDGQLNIDNDTLQGYLETNFNDIKLLFAANGTTDSGTLEYISHDLETKEGEYLVNITQAATRSNSTSDTAISGTLGFDETLTITDGDKTANVSLTSDMDISDIINAINTEFDTVYTETLAGANSVTEGGSPISASTNWDDVDGGQLLDGDVISFTGTTRSGKAVSGSYTIEDTASDTIQGFLSEIESAFYGDVTASINSAGELIITDKYSGNSQLSFTLDYSGTTNGVDIFGSVLTSNSSGQEGRYAMSITASNDGSDHLVLTHDSYGDDYSFTIEEDTDSGLWTGSNTTPVTVDNGLDVAGTINGETANGDGQTLTGNEGEANVSGLVIKYTGTDTGEIGSVKITMGVAELFDKALYYITDPYDGYLSFKKDSLQDSIDSFDSQIEEMETRLDLKMDNLVNQFIAMETAISQMQSMSSWLSAQLDSL